MAIQVVHVVMLVEHVKQGLVQATQLVPPFKEYPEAHEVQVVASEHVVQGAVHS